MIVYLTWERRPLVYTITGHVMNPDMIAGIALAKHRHHPAFRDLRSISDGNPQTC
jgi:hypothetical protein